MSLPLFPLPNLVLLPGMVVPLYIFEPRYRELLSRVQSSGESFGLLRLRLPEEEDGTHARVAEVGTLAQVVRSELHEDGTSTILIVGGERFRVLAFDEHSHSYLSAEVQTLPLEPSSPEDSAMLGWDVFERFVAAYPEDMQAMLRQNMPTESLLLCSFVASNARLGSEQMQSLLEAPTLLERWSLLGGFLPEAPAWTPPRNRTLN